MAPVPEISEGIDDPVGNGEAGETFASVPDFPGQGRSLSGPLPEEVGFPGAPITIRSAPLWPVMSGGGQVETDEGQSDKERAGAGRERGGMHDGWF